MPTPKMKVEFYKHNLGPEELASIAQACQGTILTTGAYAAQAENAMRDYLGFGECLAVDSCTAALHLALLALGIGPGDEVITTPMSFAATANSILMAGATPIFADVEPLTANLDPAKAEAAITPRTKAIMPVHLYGQMCDMRALRDLADRHGLAVVEDAAHCIEAVRDGLRPGQLGDCACLSFYATKNITCGEGGMLVSRDADFLARARRISCHGIDRSANDRYGKAYQHWDMPVFGWKYNLDNIRASLLLPQIPKMDAWRARREELSLRYMDRLGQIPGVDFPRLAADSKSAHHLQTAWVAPHLRDEVLKRLQAEQIGVAVNYRPIHLLEFYRGLGFGEGMFPVAEDIGARTITLPLYVKLEDREVDHVADTLAQVLERLAR